MAEYHESGDFEAGIQYARAHYARVVAEAIEADMVDLCPVDTGELVQSIKVEAVGDSVYVKVGTDHWVYPEYGTRYMHAQPYIRPALNRRRDIVQLGGLAF